MAKCGGRGGTINEMYYAQEIIFQFSSIRHKLRDIAEVVASLRRRGVCLHGWGVALWSEGGLSFYHSA